MKTSKPKFNVLEIGKASYTHLAPTNLRDIRFMLRRVTSIITCLPLSFVSDTLNEVLVKITNIQMSHLRIRSGERAIKTGTVETAFNSSHLDTSIRECIPHDWHDWLPHDNHGISNLKPQAWYCTLDLAIIDITKTKGKENEGLESSSWTWTSADNIFLFYGCNHMSGKK